MASVGPGLYLEIIPSAKNFASMLSKATLSDATKIGKDAGTNFSKSMSDGMAGGLTGAQKALKSASQAVSDAELSVLKSHNAVADGAEKLSLAESKLALVRQKYADGSPQVIAAENRVNSTRRATTLTSGEAAAAETRLAAAQVKQAEAQDTSVKSSKSGLAAYTGLGLAVGAAGVIMSGVAVRAAATYQTSLTKLTTTAGESQSNIKMVGDGMLAMAGQVGITAADLSAGMYTVESAGYHGADGLNVLKASAQGAKQEGADLGTVTNAVTDILTDYHMKASSAADVTSKLVETTANGKTSFEALSSSMSTIAPLASATGVSLNDMLGSIAELTSHGVTADQATQNLAAAVRGLANPSLAATKSLASLGINASDLSKNLGKTGVSGALQEVQQAVLQHMGPAGTTLLNAFNQSKQAASDANQMFSALPANLRKLAQGMQDGTVTQHQWTQGLKNIDPIQANLLKQWLTMEKRSTGFSDALKTGGNTSKTFTQAMAQATGGQASLNVALMLTGENANSTNGKIKAISGATSDAAGNVKGWGEVQGNFNQKMAETKAGFGALVIAIGQKLLPVVTVIAGWFATLAGWMSKHQTLATIVAVGIIGIATAIGIATVAFLIFNSAAMTSPVTWIIAAIILAIAALVVGITLLVKNWKTIWGSITGFVSDVWHSIESFFKSGLDAVMVPVKAVAGFFKDVWRDVSGAVSASIRTLAGVFSWLWGVLKPIFDAIGLVFRVVAAIWYLVVIEPWVLLIRDVLAPIFHWLYDTVIHPVLSAIGEFFHWLYDTVIKIVVQEIHDAVTAWGNVIKWLHDNVVQPVFNAIGDLFHWIYNNIIQPIVGFINRLIVGWGNMITWLHDNVIKPVFDAIGAIFHWIHETIINPIVSGINNDLRTVGNVFTWLHDNVIKPISDKIGSVFNAMGKAVGTVVKGIGDAWHGLMDILKVPANFIIKTFWDNGIKPLWDGVAGMFGLGAAPYVQPLAGGGVLPGYAPGKDSIPAILSPGESVLTPEATRLLGPSNILALNAKSGRRSGTHSTNGYVAAAGGFLGSGVDFGTIWSATKTALGMAGSAVGSVVTTVTDGVSKFGDFAKELSQTPNSNLGIVSAMQHVPAKILESMIKKAEDWLVGNNAKSAGGGGGASNQIPSSAHMALINQALAADGIPANLWGVWQNGLNTLITRESGWNAGAINLTDSNAKAGHPSQGLMQTIPGTFAAYRNGGLPGGITDPVANIAAGIRYILSRYGSITNVQQANPNMPPKGYKNGGWMMPGDIGVNETSRPEPVFSSAQWEIMKQGGGRSGGGHTFNYNATTHDPASVIAEIDRRQRSELAQVN